MSEEAAFFQSSVVVSSFLIVDTPSSSIVVFGVSISSSSNTFDVFSSFGISLTSCIGVVLESSKTLALLHNISSKFSVPSFGE
jgi:hypothetical protein